MFYIISLFNNYFSNSILRIYTIPSRKKNALDTIMIYKPKTQYSDKTNTQIIKKINATSKPSQNSFYKHGFG